MTDRELQELLQNLPRETASEGFTQRVVARAGVARQPRSRLRTGRLALVAVVLGVVVLLPILGRWQERRKSEEARQEQVERLRTEYRALEQELEELLRLTAESPPVVKVGETDEFDFVIDLRDLIEGVSEPGAQRVIYRAGTPE